MKWPIWLPLMLATGAALAQSTVTVMTFNIFHGETLTGDFDLDLIARVINDQQPDLVALQEVDYKTKRARGLDLATELAQRTRLTPLFGRAMFFDGGEYGEAILSRYTFLETQCIALPHRPDSEPRALLTATLMLPSGDTIVFAGTHLDHLRDDTDRLWQAQAIVSHLAGYRHPVVLAGDLNDVPGSPTIDLLQQYFSHSEPVEQYEPTYPSDQPQKRIDYIMMRPANRWVASAPRVTQDSIASDHCAYTVLLQLIPAPVSATDE